MHLCDFPEPGERDDELEWEMQVARDAVELGRAARAHGKLKVRQPLGEAVIVAAERERAAIERFGDLVRDELNVKELRFVEEAEELGRWELKPNYRSLGPRFGKHMPQVAAAVAALDAGRVAETLREGGSVGLSVDGEEHALGPDDLQMVAPAARGLPGRARGDARGRAQPGAERRRCAARASRARSCTPCRPRARAPGCNVEDRIALRLGGHDDLLDAVRAHEGYVVGGDARDHAGARRRRTASRSRSRAASS